MQAIICNFPYFCSDEVNMLIAPYGLIIKTKIKTQCALKNVLKLVGSPAVLYNVG